jgi:hypothetical protein
VLREIELGAEKRKAHSDRWTTQWKGNCMGLFGFLKGRGGASEPKRDHIKFDANGKVIKVNMRGSRWEEKRSGQNRYFTQRGRSLLHATEILKAVPSIPEQTYYVVETPDGTLGRDKIGFYTEAPIKTTVLRLETTAPVPTWVESVSLTAFGDAMTSKTFVAHLKSAGRYGAFILLLECGHCGYKSPVETKAGDFERQCYACGATNKSFRATIHINAGSRVVQI